MVLAVGARFGDRHTGDLAVYRGDRTFIHIDIAPQQIGKVFPADLGIVADAKLALAELARRATPTSAAGVDGAAGHAARDPHPAHGLRREPDQAAARLPGAQRALRRGHRLRHRDRALPDLERPVPAHLQAAPLPVLRPGRPARLGGPGVHRGQARRAGEAGRGRRRRLLLPVPDGGGRGRRPVPRAVRAGDGQQRLHGPDPPGRAAVRHEDRRRPDLGRGPGHRPRRRHARDGRRRRARDGGRRHRRRARVGAAPRPRPAASRSWSR